MLMLLVCSQPYSFAFLQHQMSTCVVELKFRCSMVFPETSHMRTQCLLGKKIKVQYEEMSPILTIGISNTHVFCHTAGVMACIRQFKIGKCSCSYTPTNISVQFFALGPSFLYYFTIFSIWMSVRVS